MKDRYVVDTNVLIAASAAYPQAPKDIDATPKDPSLRLKIFHWLDEFRESPSRLVLDYCQKIYEEYRKKLTDQDFGIQVMIHKFTTSACDYVFVAYDDNGDAQLPDTLAPTVHDRADRKMVAACLAALDEHGSCLIAFAGDTDWIDWEKALREHKVELEPIIEDWVRKKHARKSGGKKNAKKPPN